MKITCIGLDSKLYEVDKNLTHAKDLINSLTCKSDVIVLPELFTTGFYPKDIALHVDENAQKTKTLFSRLAKEKNTNIIAGSVANKQGTNIYNTSLIFDRQGRQIARYDKTHLFTNMNEDKYFSRGNSTCKFEFDGIKCGIIICYDLRFGELVKSLGDIDILFIISAWPKERLSHLKILSQSRAIENQIFVCVCNSSSNIKNINFAGNSMLINPQGEILTQGNETEHIISNNLDLSILKTLRKTINIKQDRREDLY